ncbi:Ankyrin repeat protein 1 [Giardia muris]|uniref:Ankyrin repeat protein 1 n=1 Tax=Giardia muris TaxID=5742 RepID=A0A4Z1SNU0_GIAMU|nr:Ankyrin repeat protein 1 [Giardia muris]|eukprot:TNJ27472.1 Ankyrin repeat protein 1 [Giardia muris]
MKVDDQNTTPVYTPEIRGPGECTIKTDSHGWTALMRAAKNGHSDCLTSLVDAEANLVNDESCTALMIAALHDQPACVQRLSVEATLRTAKKLVIDSHHDPVVLAPGSTALMCAAVRGYADCVEHLVGLEGGQQNDGDWTALMFSAQGGHASCVKHLLEVEKRCINIKGQSALELAIIGDHVGCVELLFGSESDLFSASGTNIMAFALNHGSFRTAMYLQGVVPNEWKLNDFMWSALSGDIGYVSAHTAQYNETVHGLTPLMLAAGSGQDLVASKISQTCTQTKDPEDRTALMFAARGGHVACVRLLAQYEARCCDHNGRTALMYAAWNGSAEAVESLGESESTCRDSLGWTALMFAASRNNVSVIPFLMNEVRARTTSCSVLLEKTYPPGLTALMIATILGHVDCAKFLITPEDDLVDADGHDARYYAEAKNLTDLLALLEPQHEYRLGSSDVGTRCSSLLGVVPYDRKVQLNNAWTSLMFAAFSGNLEGVLNALETEAGRTNSHERTALMIAVVNHHSECVKALVPFEGKMRDSSSRTALMIGAEKGHADMLNLLAVEEGLVTEKEVPLTIGDECFIVPIGSPAIIFAILANHPECVKHLARQEANIRNSEGVLPYEVAKRHGRTDIVNILRTFTQTAIESQDLSQRLVEAVDDRDLTFIRDNIRSGLDYDGYEKTALMRAAELGLRDFVVCLCPYQKGYSIQAGQQRGYTALIFATLARRTDCVAYLAEHEAGKMNARGMTALMHAAKCNDPESIKYLSSELGMHDKNGVTALMHAAYRGAQACIQPLLSEARQATTGETRWASTMPSGTTALMLAVIAGHEKVVELLKDQEADLKDSEGRTALKYALERKHQDIIRILTGESKSYAVSRTQKGFEVRVSDFMKPLSSSSLKFSSAFGSADGQTALIRAVITNDENLFKSSFAVDAGKQDKNRRTALMYAAEHGYTKFVIKLREREGGLQIRKGSYQGYTALMSAAKNGHVDCVKLLVEFEAGKIQSNGVSALMLAAANGHTECVKLLLKFEAGRSTTCGTALIQAMWRNHREAAMVLYANAEERKVSCITPLMWAAYCGDVAGTKEALKDSGSPKSRSHKIGDTALIYAAGSNSIECVELLIEYEACLQNNARFTALMHAADCNAVECVRVLREKEEGYTNYKGYTALMLAAEHGYVACVDELRNEFDATKKGEKSALTIVEEKLQKEALTDEERERYNKCKEILLQTRDTLSQDKAEVNNEDHSATHAQATIVPSVDGLDKLCTDLKSTELTTKFLPTSLNSQETREEGRPSTDTPERSCLDTQDIPNILLSEANPSSSSDLERDRILAVEARLKSMAIEMRNLCTIIIGDDKNIQADHSTH